MSTASESEINNPQGLEKKAMGMCPFCGEKPQRKMENKSKATHTSVLQKCKNGHIWRSLFATDTKFDKV